MTNKWSFYDAPAASIAFSTRGYHGKIAVYYGSNDNPHQVGYDFLPGVSFDINLCRGYPLLHARIEHYEGAGIRALFGWIQLVTGVRTPAQGAENAQPTTEISIDISPALSESDLPFYSFGSLPQVFDAPCLNLGADAELLWTADTFLTTLPIRSRAEEIAWLAGFRWGYRETDIFGQKPVLLPLEITAGLAWNAHLPFLQAEYPHWRFQAAEETHP